MALRTWLRQWSRHLYLRIWLAVVVGVALLMLVVGWAWRASVEHNNPPPVPREWVVLNAQGEVLATTTRPPGPGAPLEFDVTLPDGQQLQLRVQRNGERADPPDMGHPRGGRMASPHMSPQTSPQNSPYSSARMPPHVRNEPPWWAKPPYGFFWMLGLIGLAVALGLYPVVRRLTQRLEGLQRGVQRWGDGDLSVRVPVQGDDEVADLSARFNAAAERIEGLMASQKSLLANASHELRSPLARIRMGLELMDAAAADSATRQATRTEILRNMSELDQLIDEILLASRLDAKEADIGMVEAVDLVGLCAEECARVGAVLEVPPGLSVLEVQGVAKLLRRMVRNLLENARRYGATGIDGHANLGDDVVLSLAQQGQQVHVRVCDHGPGVPEAWRERIFEPFFRLPGASERVGGVGLGLSLVKSIAERHGGRVRCADRTGGGACFEVSFDQRPQSKTANT
ncbi:MAG: HAMP domain-containing histidine kinase [Limnohabitans sp.]|jgi:signal transduction histidine kinase|nr:HAMP domain-containing sensor histidine kinase [uncultured Limnohabitans sp.]MBP6220007.1 HAMP domain-containing histidine kinase [Limnohabitans sp.]MBP6245205.1 HAMP domain-containing histidine kinase [Limnohabitans sp.]